MAYMNLVLISTFNAFELNTMIATVAQFQMLNVNLTNLRKQAVANIEKRAETTLKESVEGETEAEVR